MFIVREKRNLGDFKGTVKRKSKSFRSLEKVSSNVYVSGKKLPLENGGGKASVQEFSNKYAKDIMNGLSCPRF